MARSSRLSVCLAIVMRNSSKIHCARSISRQRTTPCTAGIGPLSIMPAMACRCPPSLHHQERLGMLLGGEDVEIEALLSVDFDDLLDVGRSRQGNDGFAP